jgi:pyruvate kinase
MDRRTKIVCTLGPATSSPEAVRNLVEAGMNVARLNFSHGSHKEHAERIRILRDIERETGRTVAILQDLGGPKIRIGEIAGGSITIEPGREFTLTTRDVPGDNREVSVSYSPLPQEVAPGTSILLADGLIELEVSETGGTDVRCRVLVGGTLSSHKGINLPSKTLSAPALTEKDREDLEFGISQGVDLVALSFVREPEDILEVREIVRSRDARIPIIAKIEKHEALLKIAEILAASDGCMVARGDLGVEIPLERVPHVQKSIIHQARMLGRPVITATQMLTSMVDSPRPTRAEAADVANAVLDGTDAVMLSEETAVGKYPARAVQMLDRITREAERDLACDVMLGAEHPTPEVPQAISGAVCYLANTLKAVAIVVPTESGSTARLVARHRPKQPILAFSPHSETVHSLSLSWGVATRILPRSTGSDAVIADSIGAAKTAGLVKTGDIVIITAGVPIGTPGTTNLIRVEIVP